MRKMNLFAVLLLAAAPVAAHAADGTINFTGKITDKTCTISTPGGKDFAVNLPTVSKNTLAVAGAVAGRTPFAINLTKCSAGNVATQLLGANNQFLPIKAAGTNQAQDNSQWVTVAADGSANLNYAAEYYATAATTPGEVASSVKYTIIYN